MSTLLDAHVHIYPQYNPDTLLTAFRTRVTRTGASCGVIMLAEREGTDVFAAWAKGEKIPADTTVSQSDASTFVLHKPGQPDVIVVSGRQIACAERVEILALATRATFHDGMNAEDSVSAALSAGAIPVLAWGVGKWLFKRASVVEALLAKFADDKLVVGDSSLRPVFWPTPAPMSRAESLGHRVLAGSDPLPPRHEETRAGQYADLADADLDLTAPLTPQIVSLLKGGKLKHVGHRAGLFEFLRRMLVKG